jgi:hypothetical protein
MQPQHDESAYDWIRRCRNERVDSNEVGLTRNFVSYLMPTLFEAYAKVFHRIEACYENIDKPLTANEISILKNTTL